MQEVTEKEVKVRLPKQSTLSDASSRPPTSNCGNTMVGSEDVLIDIMDNLTGQQSNRQIIPIAGMGGIGKTTLAQNVYMHPLIVHHFDICAWVTISQNYNVREIILEILVCSNKKEKRETLSRINKEELGEKVYKTLSGRRYLIVMDDMWSIEVWYKLKFFFPENNNGSRIMITTRLSKLAYDLTVSRGIEINLLDEGESWNLLRQKVFGEECCPPRLEGIGQKQPVAKDFLFFSENQEIRVSSLIKLWVAEGFLKPISGKCLEETLVINKLVINKGSRKLAFALPEIWMMPHLRHVESRRFYFPDPPSVEKDKPVFVLRNLQTLLEVLNFKCAEYVVKRIPNIKKLKLFYERLEEGDVPTLSYWVQNLTFPHSLKKLTLSGTFLDWEEMSSKVGSLPLLQVLKLKDNSCKGPEWKPVEGQFCSLKYLQIHYCDDLEYWTADNINYPRLEQLVLRDLNKLTEIPLGIGDIPTLRSIQLHG
ncbi:hypothetical protein BUALT_BualtUnG0019300 [Buddleja alternifolia]|nr:hypothetical protein BUALT_BualtUnG0019300 [Buddleja alternifolia]